jgi:hypothetical protein
LPHVLADQSKHHISLYIIPCNSSESSLHVEKSVQLQMQGLQQVYEAIDHPILYTFKISTEKRNKTIPHKFVEKKTL